MMMACVWKLSSSNRGNKTENSPPVSHARQLVFCCSPLPQLVGSCFAAAVVQPCLLLTQTVALCLLLSIVCCCLLTVTLCFPFTVLRTHLIIRYVEPKIAKVRANVKQFRLVCFRAKVRANVRISG